MTLDPSADTAQSVVETDKPAGNRRDEPASGDRPSDDDSADASRRPSGQPEATAANPRLRGYIDVIEGRRIGGWAFCAGQPEHPIEVEIRRDDRTLATVRANGYRVDLHRLGIGTGRHGFEILVDEPIPSEERERITAHARLDDTAESTALPNATSARLSQSAAATPEASGAWREAALESVRRDLVAGLQSVALELRRLSDIQRTTKHPASPCEAAVAAKVAAELVPYFAQVKELLAAQATATEMLQTRADALLASLNAYNDAQLRGGRHDRSLYTIVIALGALSLVSLAVGVFSVLA